VLVATAAVGFGLGTVAQRSPPDESVFLNFDPESTGKENLVEGWSTFESTPEGDTFVWCTRRTCTLRVFARESVSRRLRARVFAFAYPGAPEQSMTVRLNGHRLGVRAISSATTVVSLQAKGSSWRSGGNLLSFDFTYAAAPSERVEGSSDRRTLSVAFDWVELVRR
jgi:hypothetical protein